jgi:hypothetical protein
VGQALSRDIDPVRGAVGRTAMDPLLSLTLATMVGTVLESKKEIEDHYSWFDSHNDMN